MLTLLFSISIAGMAKFEKRRSWLWGSLCFLVSALIQTFVVSGYPGAVLGFFATFGAMVYANCKYPVKKGPTLD
jgi:dolichol kinase